MLIRGILTTMSGSLGGITAARNKGGMYLRARVVPVDPGSFFQTAVRTIFGQLAVLWSSTLTAAQRTAWETYAENVTVVNRIGETVNLTGFQMYIRSNTPRLQAGLPRVDIGPVTMSLPAFTPMSMAVAGGGSTLSVSFTDSDAWANLDDNAALVLGAREQAPTINFFKGPYRFASSILGLTIGPPTSPAAITSPFSYTSGNKAFAQVRISLADGRLSAVQRLEAIAS
jgi:hypothetical protein